MNTIQIKTPSPERSLPLVKEALEMEKNSRAIVSRSQKVGSRRLPDSLGSPLNKSWGGVVARGEENEQDLLDLEGELELRRTLRDTLQHLEQLEVCR